jgi:DNA-binding beta-propeller fold protein YncE
MPNAYAGSNITGTDGVIAIDKVANTVLFLDPLTLKEIKAIPAPEPAVHELAISPDRRMAYVPLYGDGIYVTNRNPNNKILAIDLRQKALVDIIDLGEWKAPHGMVMSAAGDLWVVCDIPSKLLRVRPEQRAVTGVYGAPGKGPHVLTLLPDETKLYTSSKEGDIGVLDVAGTRFTGSIPVRVKGVERGNGSGSEAILPTPDGSRLLALDNSDKCNICVVDPRTDTLLERIPLQQFPFTHSKRSRLSKLAFSPDRAHLMASSYTGGLAWLIDPADYRQQTVIPVAKGPQGINYAPDGRSAYVSCHDSGVLTKIDLEARRAVAAIEVGQGIEVLAWY